MSTYSTKQRKILTEYLAENPDTLLSAEDIGDALEDSGISRSAIYRNLAELEAEGKVRRSVKEGTRKVFFQYTDSDHCRGELHLSCKVCGKTIHMDHESAEALVADIAGKQHFEIDKSDTVLFGICGNCRKK
ncbi:MAG: transcriptional repressor [Clostridia bacterium]|nr:transcriptional repressor [Clostridia bacterium]MCR5694055.1 transcriptional repressor [Clostridia bacterium]